MVVHPRVRFLVLAVAFAAGVLVSGWAAAGHIDSPLTPLHPALERMLDETSGPIAAWVFFADKRIHTRAGCEGAIERVASSYNARAIKRRTLRRSAPGLFDERDIPVADAYVDAVGQTRARLRVRSRWLNAVSVSATREQLERIAHLPFVKSVEPVRQVRTERIGRPAMTSGGNGPVGGVGSIYGRSEGQLSLINLIALHEVGYTGAGVVIGVLDTGFRTTHDAFNHRNRPLQIVAEWDFVDNDPETANEPGDSSDQHDHGTYILGALAAYLPGELVGAAYDASYILCKVEEAPSEYNGEEDFFVAGLEFIEANGGDVATSSVVIYVGYTQDDLDGLTSVMTTGVNVATANGLHVCQGAGNEGHDADPVTSHLVPPADAFDAITVGAVAPDGDIASFSSDGPTADGRVKPEVLAQGESVWTVSPGSDTAYEAVGGTSLATPQAAGVVACLVQAHPDWTVEQIRTVLFENAGYYVAHDTYDQNYVRGYGLIDAFGSFSQDCNGNGVPDADDLAQGTSDDCNENDLPDECDLDCNDNELVDVCEIWGNLTPDCDENLVPDECDPDFDGDGANDGCDTDIDGDGVPNGADSCDFTPAGLPVTSLGVAVGDGNGDCRVELGDVSTLVTRCLVYGGPGRPIWPFCTEPYDADNDQDIDLNDVGSFQRVFGQR
jgi:hypothetical protein